MTARLLVLIPRIKYYFQCVESTFYKGKSILIQTWALSETVDKLSLFLRNIQVFCSLILKCKPHKRHLPSIPAFAGLMEVQGYVLSANLRGCGVCNISLRCEEFFTTHPHFQVKFLLQTGWVGHVASDKNITGC